MQTTFLDPVVIDAEIIESLMSGKPITWAFKGESAEHQFHAEILLSPDAKEKLSKILEEDQRSSANEKTKQLYWANELWNLLAMANPNESPERITRAQKCLLRHKIWGRYALETMNMGTFKNSKKVGCVTTKIVENLKNLICLEMEGI